ncbi:hypothetical protein [Saccharothrix violaceirubra]|uniref:Ribulose 1,5-bisphosphate carboxylase large subunit n=1 Tax=Saccharothrix violaceirubra TaxID=413306 RepID=A0A7W7T0R2_9PSEU|nr:hypothetical protein [Saccharothrix violaceirubra]MBB4964477.1 hypothetical protein [Saccharothrix violaceirubra]
MDLSPRALFSFARTTVTTTVPSLVVTAASVPGRVLDLLQAAEDVVRRADALVDRTERVLEETEMVVGRARVATAAAEQVLTDASTAARTSRELVDDYAPLARQARPLAKRFVDELSPQEVDAAVELVDRLPVLTRHLIEDVLPILATLDRVGPDIHQLLEVTNDVRQAILGIPGFAFLRRRGEDREDD